jgi:hypothetical protein
MHHENMPLEQPIPHTPMAVRFIRWVRIVMAELRDPEPVRVGHEVERKGP